MISYALSNLSHRYPNLPPVRACEVSNQHLLVVTTDQRLIGLDPEGFPFDRLLPKSDGGGGAWNMAVVDHRLIYSAKGGAFIYNLLSQQEEFFPGHSFLANTYEANTLLSYDKTVLLDPKGRTYYPYGLFDLNQRQFRWMRDELAFGLKFDQGYLATGEGQLLCLDPDAGRTRWRLNACDSDGQCSDQPDPEHQNVETFWWYGLYRGSVVVGITPKQKEQPQVIAAIDLATGATRWSLPLRTAIGRWGLDAQAGRLRYFSSGWRMEIEVDEGKMVDNRRTHIETPIIDLVYGDYLIHRIASEPGEGRYVYFVGATRREDRLNSTANCVGVYDWEKDEVTWLHEFEEFDGKHFLTTLPKVGGNRLCVVDTEKKLYVFEQQE